MAVDSSEERGLRRLGRVLADTLCRILEQTRAL
jgi:hypothetical protein